MTVTRLEGLRCAQASVWQWLTGGGKEGCVSCASKPPDSDVVARRLEQTAYVAVDFWASIACIGSGLSAAGGLLSGVDPP